MIIPQNQKIFLDSYCIEIIMKNKPQFRTLLSFLDIKFYDDRTLTLPQNQEKICFRIEQYNSQSEKIMRNKPKLCVLLRIFRNKIL